MHDIYGKTARRLSVAQRSVLVSLHLSGQQDPATVRPNTLASLQSRGLVVCVDHGAPTLTLTTFGRGVVSALLDPAPEL